MPKKTTNLDYYKTPTPVNLELGDEKRESYRAISQEANARKADALTGQSQPLHPINTPRFNPSDLMLRMPKNGLTSLSLFSGGGGFDLGFDRAGYTHKGSYEIIPICEETLKRNRPDWSVFTGLTEGDVKQVDWGEYVGKVDVIHGGVPCQPFSVAGQQKGEDDERNLWKEFSRAINEIKPQAFVAENVLGILGAKFKGFVDKYIYTALTDYHISTFTVHAADFGVPQTRQRVIFIGFKKEQSSSVFRQPKSTHIWVKDEATEAQRVSHGLLGTMGVRESLGLPDIGFDNLAPTIRSAFTGKRNTTSILNSAASQKTWAAMQVWASGVQLDRERASKFLVKNGHFRLSVQDVGLLQGFPESWRFSGVAYQVLGQIGNAVAPPVAYQIALSVSKALEPVA